MMPVMVRMVSAPERFSSLPCHPKVMSQWKYDGSSSDGIVTPRIVKVPRASVISGSE